MPKDHKPTDEDCESARALQKEAQSEAQAEGTAAGRRPAAGQEAEHDQPQAAYPSERSAPKQLIERAHTENDQAQTSTQRDASVNPKQSPHPIKEIIAGPTQTKDHNLAARFQVHLRTPRTDKTAADAQQNLTES